MSKKTVLITGGCGFIGTNAVWHYLKEKKKVIIFDNLSRQGTKQNLIWLRNQGSFIFIKEDIRNEKKLLETFKKYRPDLVLHLAAQVSMISSVEKPREDFEINALGTLNVLEAMRKIKSEAVAIYSSSNKVYGQLSYIPIIEKRERYEFKDIKWIDENFPLNFHGPYSCSKGTGDQYFLDYNRIFGLNTIVFRQSTIYGPHQFGIEDQGWIAWFINRILFEKPATIYGNGKQVRDILYISDLISAFDLASKEIKKTKGKAYNIGGGKFFLSILELIEFLEKISGKKLSFKFEPPRPADQKVYISDISRAKKDFLFQLKIPPKEGIMRLYNWISQNKNLVKKSGVFRD